MWIEEIRDSGEVQPSFQTMVVMNLWSLWPSGISVNMEANIPYGWSWYPGTLSPSNDNSNLFWPSNLSKVILSSFPAHSYNKESWPFLIMLLALSSWWFFSGVYVWPLQEHQNNPGPGLMSPAHFLCLRLSGSAWSWQKWASHYHEHIMSP